MDKVYDKRKKEIHGKKFLFLHWIIINIMVLITSCWQPWFIDYNPWSINLYCQQQTEINWQTKYGKLLGTLVQMYNV